MKCTECDGRGWHVGECHPRETCGVCMGLGTDEMPVMKRERDRYEKALREIVELMADRQKFVLLGPRAAAPIERIAKAALSGSAT